GEFRHRRVGPGRASLGPHAHQAHALETKRAVLGVVDVLEFGRQSPDAPQRRALLELKLTDRRIVLTRSPGGRPGRVAGGGRHAGHVCCGVIVHARPSSHTPRRTASGPRDAASDQRSRPSATNTDGPVSVDPPSVTVTTSSPPVTSTTTSPVASPASARSTTAVSTIPVPHDIVSPDPRSWTRMRTLPPASGVANSTLTPSGKNSPSNCGARSTGRA